MKRERSASKTATAPRKQNVPPEDRAMDTKAQRTYVKTKRGLPAGITFSKFEGEPLVVKKVETSKDKILQPRLARDPRKIIPHLGASIVINGKSGSGKSTLLANLITGPQFFGKCPEKPKGWFDKIFLFSPTAGGDDIQQALGICKEHVYTDLDQAPELIKVILDSQAEKLDGGGKAHEVEQYAVIFDDVIGETTFMNTKEFAQTFYMVRHRNCTTFICSQHYKRVPKVCRLQASFVFFFAGSAAEVEQVVEDFAPPLYSKNEFRDLVQEATRGDHSFLTICMKVGWGMRFRRNLDEFITLDRLQNEEGGAQDKEGEKSEQGVSKRQRGSELRKDVSPASKISVDDSNDFHRNLATVVKFFLDRHAVNEQKGARGRQC